MKNRKTAKRDLDRDRRTHKRLDKTVGYREKNAEQHIARGHLDNHYLPIKRKGSKKPIMETKRQITPKKRAAIISPQVILKSNPPD